MAGSDLRLSSAGRERLVQIIARLRSLQASSVAASGWNDLLASLEALAAGQTVRRRGPTRFGAVILGAAAPLHSAARSAPCLFAAPQPRVGFGNRQLLPWPSRRQLRFATRERAQRSLLRRPGCLARLAAWRAR
jgi:hypothetical protein